MLDELEERKGVTAWDGRPARIEKGNCEWIANEAVRTTHEDTRMCDIEREELRRSED